ncbi:DUF3667 domain-containing protein [Aureitalea sp. L0-47]|uniref:DUF3667 domain-containing protein n=1 Tax=Aureitalea sp. L0-47 TaxID=2816962 RepID=UPI0022372C8E|nr:DUF3667 domain-containing protein [Aureitalea sp. L0-47]MCW5520127.1 DUF3667 domain-containing protein [Aureitalea sp. L0-47]
MSDNKPVPVKGRKAMKYRAAECKNCGHPLELTDRYCSYCSQMNTTKSLALKDFFGEFIGSIITYDSRFRHTLKDLLFKPGVITRNYVNGQRLKYANPFRFYLSVSIIYFILQSLVSTFTGNSQLIDDTSLNNGPTNNLGAVIDSLEQNARILDSKTADSIIQNNDNLSRLDSILKTKNINVNTKELDSLFAEENINLNEIDVDSLVRETSLLNLIRGKKENTYEKISEATLDTMNWGKRNFQRFMLYRDFYKATEISNPAIALDSLKHRNNAYNRWAYSKNESIEKIEKNPGDFMEYLLEKTPFFLFFFTPVYALFFWLVYSAKKYTYMEHMIFIFHIFSFVFLAGIICMIPDSIISGGNDNIVFSIVLTLVGPFYFYKALRNFYQQNRLLTIIKFIFLNWIFWIGATIAAALFFSVTAAMY